MTQSFQCPICGIYNAFGEPECRQCKQAFVYNCPVCGTRINNHYNRCAGCGTIFNWCNLPDHNQFDNIASNIYEKQVTPPPTQQAEIDTTTAIPSQNTKVGTGKPDLTQTTNNSPEVRGKPGLFSNWRFWAMLMLACIALTIILFLIDIFLLSK